MIESPGFELQLVTTKPAMRGKRRLFMQVSLRNARSVGHRPESLGFFSGGSPGSWGDPLEIRAAGEDSSFGHTNRGAPQ